MFFKGIGNGDELPYLGEYLLCSDFGWTWQQLQATPAHVLAYWTLYRSMKIQVQNAANEG